MSVKIHNSTRCKIRIHEQHTIKIFFLDSTHHAGLNFSSAIEALRFKANYVTHNSVQTIFPCLSLHTRAHIHTSTPHHTK